MKYRVIPMQCGNDESYALVFYEQEEVVKVDVYDASTKEKVASLDSPFPVGGISDIRYVQSYDVLFFAQPDTYPCKFRRENDEENGGYKFSFEDSEFLPEPVMEWNENDDHEISLFVLPDADLLVDNGSGEKVFPKGVCRLDDGTESITVAYSTHDGITLDMDEYRGPHTGAGGYTYYRELELSVKIYVSGKLENWRKIDRSGIITFSEPIGIKCNAGLLVRPKYGDGYWTHDSDGNDSLDEDPTCSRDIYGNVYTPTAEIKDRTVYFATGRVESLSDAGVKIYVGTVCYRFWVQYSDKTDFYRLLSGSNFVGVNTVTAPIPVRGSMFRITNTDNVAVSEDVKTSTKYSPSTGGGFKLAMTIDGTNTNENICIGQVLALKKDAPMWESTCWSYDDFPTGVEPSVPPSPAVETEPLLPSKKATNGDELRPLSGGGYGFASDWRHVRGSITLKTEGVWSGIIILQEMGDSWSPYTIATISSENGLSNTELERDISDFGRCVRVACTRREYAYTVEKYSDGSTKTFKDDTGCQWTLTADSATAAYVRVLERKVLSDGTNAFVVEAIGGVGEPITARSYALGAWSTKNGYPRHITIFQERLVYAGNKEKPMTVWMSKTNKWKDFELGTDDTSAITATLATEKYDSIEWLTLNKNSILLGSKYNEFSIGANDGTVTTADNILASTMSSIGGAAIPAAKVGTSTLMVKVGREELHKVEFNALSEQSTGTQVSMLARHLFEGDRIKDVFSIQSPRNMLFCVHESGKLSSLTYEQEFDVLGFARHDVLDGVESGCVIRRGGRDVLCMVVREGDSYVLGEIDFDSDVWTDDGKNYESEVLTTPMKPQSKYATSGYGRQMNIAGADVYVSSDSRQFRARLVGSDVVDVDWVRVDNGFNTDGELRGWGRQKVELPMTGSWLEEPMVEIKCDTAHPLTVYGIGAALAQGN